jgi:hypothetical protein
LVEIGRIALKTIHVTAGEEVCEEGQSFVLKRILVSKGQDAHLSGLREAYFGQLLQNRSIAAPRLVEDGRNHIVRFVEFFEVSSGPQMVI